MARVTIHIPDEIAEHEGDIRYFLDSMVRKLAVNSFKGWVSKDDAIKMFKAIDDECIELKHALQDENQFAAFMEAVDVANMALLTAVAVSKQTRPEFDANKGNLNELF